MRIAIVDDNSTEQEKLAKPLGDWSTAHHLTPEIILFDSGDAFLNSLSETAYELVFMDIIMDGKNGIETAQLMRRMTLETLLIFLTSSREYMEQAFPCHAFDYVIKPYRKEQIIRVLNEAMRQLNKGGEYIEFRVNRQLCRLLLTDILYV